MEFPVTLAAATICSAGFGILYVSTTLYLYRAARLANMRTSALSLGYTASYYILSRSIRGRSLLVFPASTALSMPLGPHFIYERGKTTYSMVI